MKTDYTDEGINPLYSQIKPLKNQQRNLLIHLNSHIRLHLKPSSNVRSLMSIQ